MYTLTKVRADDNSDRTVWACRALVWTSVAVSVIGFWSKGIVPTAILSVVMIATVTLVSYSLGRLVLAWKVRDIRLLLQMGALAGVFIVIESQLNHLGLGWLNDTYNLATADQVEIAKWFLPLVNLFATDSFTREIKVVEPTAIEATVSPAKALADLRWAKGKKTA